MLLDIAGSSCQLATVEDASRREASVYLATWWPFCFYHFLDKYSAFLQVKHTQLQQVSAIF